MNKSNPLKKSENNNIRCHYMINNGLKEMAANAVELVVDEMPGIAYAVYLSSETSIGESSELVNLAKFNILQPTNVEWITVFNKSTGNLDTDKCWGSVYIDTSGTKGPDALGQDVFVFGLNSQGVAR